MDISKSKGLKKKLATIEELQNKRDIIDDKRRRTYEEMLTLLLEESGRTGDVIRKETRHRGKLEIQMSSSESYPFSIVFMAAKRGGGHRKEPCPELYNHMCISDERSLVFAFEVLTEAFEPAPPLKPRKKPVKKEEKA